MMAVLKALETSGATEPNMATFCLHCRSGTCPRIVCLGCAGVFCFQNPELPAPCFLRGHASKSSKCHLGMDLVCRELFCLVCGAMVMPDDQELQLLSRRLFPAVRRAFAPGCLARTTSTIFPARGFRNLGNTCYMNVVLQILLRIPELQTYLLTDHHNRLKHRPTEDQPYACCCVCELVDFLQHYSAHALPPASSSPKSPPDSISPIGFLFALWANSADGDEFAGYRESDAHECLLACLNQLHTATQVPSGLPTTGEGVVGCQCPIDLLFRCELRSLVVCGSCGEQSETVDPLLDLSLEIAHLAHLPLLRLQDCLDSFTRPERLKEKCYTCSRCLIASPDTTKALAFERLPHILCFQLKRFEHHGSTSVKLDKHVQFPLLLDMGPFVARGSEPARKTMGDTGLYYRLTGIVRHQGSVTSGHYQAIVWQDEQWFCFNDETVSLVTLQHLRAIEAYLLVYSFVPSS